MERTDSGRKRRISDEFRGGSESSEESLLSPLARLHAGGAAPVRSPAQSPHVEKKSNTTTQQQHQHQQRQEAQRQQMQQVQMRLHQQQAQQQQLAQQQQMEAAAQQLFQLVLQHETFPGCTLLPELAEEVTRALLQLAPDPGALLPLLQGRGALAARVDEFLSARDLHEGGGGEEPSAPRSGGGRAPRGRS